MRVQSVFFNNYGVRNSGKGHQNKKGSNPQFKGYELNYQAMFGDYDSYCTLYKDGQALISASGGRYAPSYESAVSQAVYAIHPERYSVKIVSRNVNNKSGKVYIASPDEEIPQETFNKLKEMFPYIPTGCNTNTLYFSIIESKSAMDTIREKVRKKILKLISNKLFSPLGKKFEHYKTNFENGEDLIFRNAPHMIVVSSSINAPCANVDPIIALSYIELYAQSMGLGTCWCGFAQACFKFMPEFAPILDIPDGYKPVYVMLLGKPDIKYTRTTLPESFPISEIKEIDETCQTFSQKARRLLLNFIR